MHTHTHTYALELYIFLSHTRIPENQAANITVYGHNWPPSASQTIIIQG